MRQKPNARQLKHNKLTRFPQYFCFVDTETILHDNGNNRIKHSLRLGVTILNRKRKDERKDKKEVIRFTTAKEFWDVALGFIKGKNTLHLIAHNALFDVTVLKHRKWLTYHGYNCDFVFEDGVVFISKWSKGDTRVMILDNSNWFKGKLSKWGDKLNLPKLEMPENDQSKETWFIYCERDVEILYRLQEWFISFLIDNDLGNWRYTLASCSFNAYRHRFMKHPIYIPDKSRETYLARASYRGGRTECFYVGQHDNGPYYKLDINSMYPAIMRDNSFPVCVEGYVKRPTRRTILNYLDTGGAIANVELDCTEPYFPMVYNDKTCYPIGKLRTTLTTPELKIALENDWVTKIHECSLYRMRPIFTEFVEFFYQARLRYRQEGDELRSYLFKIFLNSLYGKFGQRGYKDKVIGAAEPGSWETSYGYDIVTGEKSIIRQMGRNIIKSSRKGEGYNAFVAIASHVTGYSRIFLYRLVIKANRENVYYTDTDSLIVNKAGFDNLKPLITPDRIGYLKVESASPRVILNAPKHYFFDGKWTIKGIRSNADKLSNGVFRQEIWPGLNRILAEKEEVYYNYFQTKTLRSTVESGTVLPNGQVTPFVFNGQEVNTDEPRATGNGTSKPATRRGINIKAVLPFVS